MCLTRAAFSGRPYACTERCWPGSSAWLSRTLGFVFLLGSAWGFGPDHRAMVPGPGLHWHTSLPRSQMPLPRVTPARATRVSEEAFDAMIEDHSTPILVDFFADW